MSWRCHSFRSTAGTSLVKASPGSVFSIPDNSAAKPKQQHKQPKQTDNHNNSTNYNPEPKALAPQGYHQVQQSHKRRGLSANQQNGSVGFGNECQQTDQVCQVKYLFQLKKLPMCSEAQILKPCLRWIALMPTSRGRKYTTENTTPEPYIVEHHRP